MCACACLVYKVLKPNAKGFTHDAHIFEHRPSERRGVTLTQEAHAEGCWLPIGQIGSTIVGAPPTAAPTCARKRPPLAPAPAPAPAPPTAADAHAARASRALRRSGPSPSSTATPSQVPAAAPSATHSQKRGRSEVAASPSRSPNRPRRAGTPPQSFYDYKQQSPMARNASL